VGTYRHTSLRVFDVLGREVATLVNEKKEAGSYQVKFDGTGLSNGLYIYRLFVAPTATRDYVPTARDGHVGGLTVTKRMVLLK
jgi:hypothetical protein